MPKQNEQKKFKKIFEEVSSSQDSVEVKFRGHVVSDKPLYSFNYLDCVGVVLLNHCVAGLSHYTELYNESTSPEFYLQKMINEINMLERSDITAIVIGGRRGYFDRNKCVLYSHNIPIVGEYFDDWGYNCSASKKSVVVIPSTQEIIVYNSSLYRRLH